MLDEFNRAEKLHFLSQYEKIESGCASQLVWHQYRDEFAALQPANSKGILITLSEKIENITTGNFFSKKVIQKTNIVVSDTFSKTVLCIYEIPEN